MKIKLSFVILLFGLIPASQSLLATPREPSTAFRENILAQDAGASVLVAALKSVDAEAQRGALVALTKIVTNTALRQLVENRDRVLSENLTAYCTALAAMSNVTKAQVGEIINDELRRAAVVIAAAVSGNAELPNSSRAQCFVTIARLSKNSDRAAVESAFLALGLENLESSDLETALLGLFYHRLDSLDPADPTNRYWFSAEVATKIRSLNLFLASDGDLREAYARVAYLANDDSVYSDYLVLLKDSEPRVRFFAATLINFKNKTDFLGLNQALSDLNPQVVVAAIEQLKLLKQSELLFKDHFKLVAHPSSQVRRSFLSAIENLVDLSVVQELMSDASIAVRQLATAIFLRGVPDKTQTIAEILESSDLAKKRGLIDAAASFTTGDRLQLMTALVADSNPFVVTYAMDAIAENKMTELYPLAIEFLSAETQELRFPAVQVLLNWTDYPERLRLLEQSYAISISPFFEYVRSEIVTQLAANNEAAEIALLKSFLALETEWKLYNQITEKLNSIEGTSLALRQPSWKGSSGESYFVSVPRPEIEIQTTKGTMTFELFNDLAPIHVSLVLSAIERGHWNRNFFHRVIDNFVAQSYRPISASSEPSGDMRAEIVGLKQERGTIAMPRSDYLHSGDAGGFYINLISNYGLNNDYTVFGKILTGDDVLAKLEIGDQVLAVKRTK